MATDDMTDAQWSASDATARKREQALDDAEEIASLLEDAMIENGYSEETAYKHAQKLYRTEVAKIQ